MQEPLLKVQGSFFPPDHPTCQAVFPKGGEEGTSKANVCKCFSLCDQVQLASRQTNLPFHSPTDHLVCPSGISLFLQKFPFCLSHSFKPDFTHQKLPGSIPRPRQSQPLGPLSNRSRGSRLDVHHQYNLDI